MIVFSVIKLKEMFWSGKSNYLLFACFQLTVEVFTLSLSIAKLQAEIYEYQFALGRFFLD